MSDLWPDYTAELKAAHDKIERLRKGQAMTDPHQIARSEPEDTYEGEGPKCPYCGRQYTADEPHYYDEINYTEEECDDCGNTFEVEVQSSVVWACYPRAIIEEHSNGK